MAPETATRQQAEATAHATAARLQQGGRGRLPRDLHRRVTRLLARYERNWTKARRAFPVPDQIEPDVVFRPAALSPARKRDGARG